MAHLVTKDGVARVRVEEEWLPATARLNDYVARVAGLPHLAVKIGPTLAAEAGTAQFYPPLAEIQMNSTVLAPGMDPRECNPQDDLFRARFPLLMGALLHETAHARYSRWVPRDLSEGEAEGRFKGRLTEVLIAAEEGRIEKRLLRRYATAGQYLPAIVMDLLAREFHGGDDPYSASILLALTVGRAEAGTITHRDAKPFRDLIGEHLTDEQMDTLLGLLSEYHALKFRKHEDLPLDDMESIATRWLESLGLDPAEEAEGATMVLIAHDDGEGTGEGDEAADGDSDGSGEGDEGEGEGEGSGEGEGKEAAERPSKDGGLGKAARDAAESIKHDRQMDAAEKVKAIRFKRSKDEVKDAAERREEAADERDKVFGRKHVGDHSGGATVGHHSRLQPQKPEAAHMVAGTVFARKLGKVMLVEPHRSKAPMVKPGKRLRGRGAVQRRVQERRGQIPTARQWEGTVRHMTDELPLRVGVAVDISGSMNALAMPLATTAFVVGNGVEKAGGTYAQVAFGAGTSGIVKAGRKVSTIPFVHPADPWEDIKGAMLALDGELDLVDGDGVRVLVVASDGLFVQRGQHEAADKMWPEWSAKGVVILHLDFEDGMVMRNAGGHYNAPHNNPRAPLVIDPDLPPAKIAEIVGDAIIAEVAAEQARRAGV